MTETESQSMDPMLDLYLPLEDDEILDKDMIDRNHDLIDENLLKYLYEIEDGTELPPNTLENMSVSTRQLYELIKT